MRGVIPCSVTQNKIIASSSSLRKHLSTRNTAVNVSKLFGTSQTSVFSCKADPEGILLWELGGGGRSKNSILVEFKPEQNPVILSSCNCFPQNTIEILSYDYWVNSSRRQRVKIWADSQIMLIRKS